MGTVAVFAETRRAAHQKQPPVQAGSASVVILPVIRIEREGAGWSGPITENSKPRSPRKGRKRATRT
jgi:hypothetical protein